jgi:NADH-quinone oxidoreductase subunit N
MDLGTLLTSSLTDTLDVSLPHFRTELALSATIVLVLLCRMLPVLRWLDSGFVAMGGVAFALWYAWCDFRGLPGSPWATIAATQPGSMELFGGLLVFDSLTAYIRLLLCGFLVLYILFTKVTGIPDREDGADFYTLVLGSSLGMCLMASANHLLMLFMAVEMASVPSYALAGLLKGRKASSEAALKYAVYGAGAAGVMLYGLSLLAGVLAAISPTHGSRYSVRRWLRWRLRLARSRPRPRAAALPPGHAAASRSLLPGRRSRRRWRRAGLRLSPLATGCLRQRPRL